MPKTLIYLFDGTWVSASERHSKQRYSNIFRINCAMEFLDHYNRHQVVFYSPGIGTRAAGDIFTGGAFGKGFERIIESAYINLCSNIQEDDRVIILGYSRGGVLAMALAAFISEIGIIDPSKLDQFDIAWKQYLGMDPGGTIEKDKRFDGREQKIVKFLGLFDPVFSGFRPFVTKYFQEKIVNLEKLPREVEECVSIFAIDERRVVYSPVTFKSHSANQSLKQIWLPGSHGDIGGTNQQNHFGELALRCMIENLKHHVRFSRSEISKIDASIQGFESNTDNYVVNKMNFLRFLGTKKREFKKERIFLVHTFLRDYKDPSRKIDRMGALANISSAYANELKGLSYSKWHTARPPA